MSFNQLFFGSKAVIEIETPQSIDEVKNKLASTYTHKRNDFAALFEDEPLQAYQTEYVYQLKKNKLRIYFAKQLNKKFNHSFQLIYPVFYGTIESQDDKVIITGDIGYPQRSYYFSLLWFSFFILVFIAWLNEGENQVRQGGFAIVFIAFGLLSAAINMYRTSKKVGILKHEIESKLTNVC